uniref:Peptidase S1 domain-containing protein n=1 Tax=Ciona savignyi TaxID=51511 RepID=H2ZGI0_CIOSA
TETLPASTDVEPKCGVGMFSCKDEQCIDVRWRCDGYNDCGEWEDEQDCAKLIPQFHNGSTLTPLLHSNISTVCTYDQFRCSNRQCVEGSRACDGYYDCLDRSDELQCEECSYGQFKCRNSTDGPGHQCLPMTSRCDGVTQCNDGSDEVDCNCNDLNRCVETGTFRCRSGGKCLTMSHVCDGHNDCPENSDEDSCSTHVQITCKPRSCGKRNDVTDGRRIYTRILGGRTSRDRTWPWVTSLTLPGMKHVCGATLVRPEWLISAAHCFQEEGLGVWKARLGTGNGGVMEFNVTDVVVHPRYNAEAVDFDIALVKLGGRVRSFNAEPLCLPTFDIDPGSYCVIAGWGVTEGLQGGTRKLQEGSVHVIERSTCQRYYPNHVISDRMMCAGRGGTVDACSGDSGGPMMCWHPQRRQWQLSGVTSWGSSCTPHSAPGVYTDVKYFSKWAERQ